MFAEPGEVAGEVGGAGGGDDDAHLFEGVHDAHLVLGKLWFEAEFFPVLEVHAGGVEEGEDLDLGALAGDVFEELGAGFFDGFVGDAGDLDGSDGDHLVGAVDLAESDEEAEHAFLDGAFFAVEDFFFIWGEVHRTSILQV